MASVRHSYDLLTQPWIPVIASDGMSRRVGLADLLRDAASLHAVAGVPPVRVAVLRLAVAVLRDALGQGAIDEAWWRASWKAGELPHDAVADYLSRHHDRFDLFSRTHPFLQDPALQGDRTAVRSVAELTPHLPKGNNATLIHRTTDLHGPNPVRFDFADAACWLVSLHAHVRPGSTAARHAAPPGRVSGRAGPLLGRLLAVPDCENLARTLLLNLPRAAREPFDLPAYRAPEPVRVGDDACGPVSLLTWTSRHVLLLPDDGATVTAVKLAADEYPDPLVPRGTQASHDPHLLAAPAANVVNGWTLETASRCRTPLADTAIVARHAASAAPGSVLPAAVAMAAEHRSVRVCVYGLAVESTAKYTDWTVNSIPCVSHGSIAAAAEAARLAADAAGVAAAALTRMDDRFGGAASAHGPAAGERASEAVWRQLDAPGRELLVRLTQRRATGAELARWQRLCADAARTAINELTCRCARGSSQPCAHKEVGVRAAARLEQSLAATAEALR